MIKKIFFSFSVIIFFSCSSQTEVPSGIIQPEKMKQVLWDVVRAQYLAGQVALKDSLTTVSTETKALTAKVFKIHKITSATFEKSYAWYIKHPQVMSDIFDSLYTQKQREIRLAPENKLPKVDGVELPVTKEIRLAPENKPLGKPLNNKIIPHE